MNESTSATMSECDFWEQVIEDIPASSLYSWIAWRKTSHNKMALKQPCLETYVYRNLSVGAKLPPM